MDCQFLIFDEEASMTPENRGDRVRDDVEEVERECVPRQDCRPQPAGKSVFDNREKAAEGSEANI